MFMHVSFSGGLQDLITFYFFRLHVASLSLKGQALQGAVRR
jgi:hypothetical protein